MNGGEGWGGEEEEVGGQGHTNVPRRVSRVRQFAAVLHKNYLLQTRASRTWARFGASGWVSLLLEILVPGVFFALMCIPKHYLNPQFIPRQLSPAYDLDLAKWGLDYAGPAALHDNRALLLYAPNTTAAMALMATFAKSVSCPEDAAKKGPASTSFYAYFRPTLPSAACTAQPACLTDASCSQHLLGTQIIGLRTVEEAVERASLEADTVDAVVALDESSGDNFGYTLRVNHTELPSTRGRLNNLDVRPDDQYMKYWLFANLQLHLDRAIQGLAANQTAGLPALVDVQIKPFPWPAGTLDIGAAAAAAAFNLLIVFAFLSPTRGMVAAIVREKELRLREGMRILGLKDAAYWASWALSHFATLALSGFICAVISLYPFRHSSFSVMLALFFLIAAALIAFAYFMSTLFSTSRVAGIASAQLFAISMVPGYVMPTFQPYGGLGWYFACLAPPSCISLFASVLVKIEVSQQGLHWNSLGLNVTNESAFPFSALTVFIMLAVDVLLYATLAFYLDRVIPSEVGQNLPWYFPLQHSHWFKRQSTAKTADNTASAASASDLHAADSALAVSIVDLQKVFSTTEGVPKRAVDGLTLDIYQSQITALLGANGAGKTTTISILTGMLAPSGGNAFVHGQSILHEMGAIRQNLGVCPQFDILWPDISVREHLHLYAAIKGYSFKASRSAAIAAARDVGLEDKLDTVAGSLSGGQRRKLSVAIAFLGSPAVVFLDEPTSGMDPYSRRFTWEIIKRHKAGRAVVLTTHSMEEADLLCDRIAIMADGSLAALGTSMDLKSRFGVGYTLTVAKTRSQHGSEATLGHEGQGSRAPSLREVGSQQSISEMSDGDAEVDALVKRHVPGARLALRGAAELSFKLPKEDAARFPDLLRELEAGKDDMGVSSYGLAETTLEEVFLTVATRGGVADTSQAKSATSSGPAIDHHTAAEERPLLGDSDLEEGAGTSEAAGYPPREPLKGGWLYMQQLWALFVKRAISARRDRLALVTQLLVPIALVLVALLAGRSSMSFPQEPAAPISRSWSLFGAPTVFAASPEARANSTAMGAFLGVYPDSDLTLTEEQKLWAPPFWSPVNGTLDGYLLDHWFQRRASYDAIFINSWANTSQVLDASIPVQYTILVNQTATHAIPAALNAANTALLRAATGRGDANISVINYPLPTLTHEAAIQVSQAAGDLLTVLCTTMAFALLSASFALFLVREKECQSKHVQLVSGAPVSAFWLATFTWDLLNFCIPAAGILICYAAFNLPQFQGPRLAALSALFFVFGIAALPLSYLLHSFFEDEMKALQIMNTILFLSGYLGFLASWILDMLFMFMHKPAIHKANQITQHILRTVSPHFNLARGMYEVSQTHKQDAGEHDTSPWAWQPTGQWFVFFAVQAAVYGALVLLLEAGWGSWVLQRLQRTWLQCKTCCGARGRAYRAAATEEDWPEDEDVQAERLALQDGKEGFQVLMAGLQKSYSVGLTQPLVRAVRGVWVGIPQGECFGLLGVNGAGKTTTFKILTGEVLPDAGDAYICGESVLRSLAAARRRLGYCPQFSALPGALTGREVLRMYARLRGVPPGDVEAAVQTLLKRLDFIQYADRACESYSGGNKRKLSVAVALVGEPPVVMLDEPSTGMDPGAKRFLWDIIQAQVIDRGHTVLLTSHSMEECEALCTRIAIMRAGQFRCLGAVQHLKNRFGAGYVLQLRLRPGQTPAAVVEAVKAECPAAELSQDADSRLSFRIPQQGLDLPALFEAMESSRQSLGIEEYSISQTTLEHVFIELAQQR